MREITYITLVASISIFSPASAQNIAGIGAASCRDVLRYIDEKPFQTQLYAWVTGFLSGINMTNVSGGRGYRDLTQINSDVVLGEVRAACAKTPGKPVISAIEPMYMKFPATQ